MNSTFLCLYWHGLILPGVSWPSNLIGHYRNFPKDSLVLQSKTSTSDIRHKFLILLFPSLDCWIVIVEEEKGFLDPVRAPGWVWKLSWQKWFNRRKMHKVTKCKFTWHADHQKKMKTQRNRPEYFYARFDEAWAVTWKYGRSEYEISVINWGNA